MEVARAIKDAASATPPAFSPGASRGATPSSLGAMYPTGSYTDDRGGQFLTQSQMHKQQAALARDAGRMLMGGLGGSGSHIQGEPISFYFARLFTKLTLSNSNSRQFSGSPLVGSLSSSHNTNNNNSNNDVSSNQLTASIPGNVGMMTQFTQGKRSRRWYLGIQSKKDPAHVMTEVYKALLSLGCEWRPDGQFQFKCRWYPNRSREKNKANILNNNIKMMSKNNDDTNINNNNNSNSSNSNNNSNSNDDDDDDEGERAMNPANGYRRQNFSNGTNSLNSFGSLHSPPPCSNKNAPRFARAGGKKRRKSDPTVTLVGSPSPPPPPPPQNPPTPQK